MDYSRYGTGGARSTSTDPAGFYHGVVKAVDGDTVTVQVPRLFGGAQIPNIPVVGVTPSVDDSVFVSFIEGRRGALLAFPLEATAPSGGGSSVTVSDDPPSSPSEGDLWYESDTGKTFVYYDSGWVEIGGAAATPRLIEDADADTKVQVEESADEDKIRFDVAGVETMVLDDSSLTVTGDVTADTFFGDLQGPSHIAVKNTSGGTLTKGTAVYATGSVGASGAVEVQASDNTNSATMPALGLLDEDLGTGDTGSATIFGVIRNLDTSGYASNDELWINGSGALQNTRPTSGLIQKIGRVVRVHASTGEILVMGAGRTNDVPFPLFVDHVNQYVGIGTTAPERALHVNSGTVNTAALFESTDANVRIYMQDSGSTDAEQVGLLGVSDDLRLVAGGGARMAITSGGNVGIGTTSPGAQLEIANTGSGQLYATADGFYVDQNKSQLDTLFLRSQGPVDISSDFDGGTSNDYIRFLTDNSTERMRITQDGNVGIGTTSPGAALDVAGDIIVNDVTPRLTLKDTDTGTSNAAIQMRDTADTILAQIKMGGSNDLYFDVAGSTRMFIADDGKVGIGTPSGPTAELEVRGASDPEIRIIASDGSDPALYFGDTTDLVRGGFVYDTSNNDLQFRGYNNTTVMTIESDGQVGIGTTSPGALLHVNAGTVNNVATFESTDAGAIISLKDDSTTGNSYVGIRADGDVLSLRAGNSNRVRINGTEMYPGTDNALDLGTASFRYDDVYATNGTIQTSDARDKKDVTDLDLGLDFVNALRPVSFVWDDRSGHVGTREHMGLIAQEVAGTLGDQAADRAVWVSSPAWQISDEEGGVIDMPERQGIRYEELIAPMVKSIQELSAQNAELSAQNADLITRIEALEAE